MITQQLSWLAAALPPAGFAWYVRDTLHGSTQPDRISWAGWALAPLVGFSAEVAQGTSTLTALPVLGFGVGPALVVAASFYNPQAYWKLGWLDVLCGSVIVGAVAAWAATGEGNIAIALSIGADGAAAAPTIAKAWAHPASESIGTYLASGTGAVLTLLTLRRLTFATGAFPLYVAVVCTLITVLITRKWKERKYGRERDTRAGRAAGTAGGWSRHRRGGLAGRGRDLRHGGVSRQNAVLRTAEQRTPLQRHCASGILMARLRRPGSPWRFLVHEYNPGWRQRKDQLAYTKSYHFSNDPLDAARHKEVHEALGDAAEYWEETCLPGTEFDEVVVGRWLHVEAQNETEWWMSIGGVTVFVVADRDGRPRSVRVLGPGDYDDRNPNVTYSLTWTEEDMNDYKPAHRKPTRWQLMVQHHRENKAQRAIKRGAKRRQRRGGGEHVKAD